MVAGDWLVTIPIDHLGFLPVVRDSIELFTSPDPLPVAGLGGPDHISPESVPQYIVCGDFLQVVDKVDRVDVCHLGEDFPIGVCSSNALLIPVGSAVSPLGTALDDGVGGNVLSIVSLLGEDVLDFLHHPVGFPGFGGLESGVGPG